MNIKITYEWLMEYLDTDADPYELQKYLSLCGPGVERVEKIGEDYVLDIEITTNRIDMASVLGIAQEAQAILPQFGKRAKLRKNPLTHQHLRSLTPARKFPLTITIADDRLATRAMAYVMSDVQIAQSPELIRKRLELCDIRSINNVVDVTNYVMLSMGQPCHVFDYDKIGGHTLLIRESRAGEKVTTLDNREITLPGGDIVIEDGHHRLIDLCGIMGGLNSAVSESTQNIVLFTQTYNKRLIRRTSMLTAARSVAATYFEKGLDEERCEPALVEGAKMLTELARAHGAFPVQDLYKKRMKPRTITVSMSYINNRIGVTIPEKTQLQILKDLGFEVHINRGVFTIQVPHFRKHDIEIPEDIVEEVARIYGYHTIPGQLPPAAYVQQPPDVARLLKYTDIIKKYFKHIGLTEQMNYSMISREMIESMNMDPNNHLRLTNTISEELQYMRISLLPSLVANMRTNYNKRAELKFFELSKVYYPHVDTLPQEIWKLGVVVNTSFADLKGIFEALMHELRISDYVIRRGEVGMFARNRQADFVVQDGIIGSIGKLSSEITKQCGLREDVYLAGFDILSLIQHARTHREYKQINPYAVVKLDLTIEFGVHSYADIQARARSVSPHLEEVEYIGAYEHKKTYRFYFSSHTKNLTEAEAKAELESIKDALQ